MHAQTPECSVLDTQCKIAEYTKLIEAKPKDAEPYLSRAFLFEVRGECRKAIDDFSSFISLADVKSDLLANAFAQRAACFAISGYTDRAIHDYTSAMDRDSKDPRLFYARAALFFAENNYDRAIEDFNSAIQLDPKYVEAINFRGNAYLWKKNRKKAFIDFNYAIELDPNNADAHFNRAYEYDDRKEYTKAIADYDKFIELSTKFPWRLPIAYGNRASAYSSLDKNDLALRDLTLAITLSPKDASYYSERARVYRKLHQTALAESDEKRAAELR